MISPLLPSCCGFSFALGCGVSFSDGIQHSPVNSCSAASYSLGVLAAPGGRRRGRGKAGSRGQRLRGPTVVGASPGTVPPTAGHPAETKFSKPAFSSMWIVNFQMFKVDLEKAEEPEIKLPTSIRSSKKQESSRKTSTSVLLTMPKRLTVWITTNGGKFLKRWEYQTAWSASWEICMQVKKQQLELDIEQQVCFQIRKEYVKAVYCHPAYLTYMQSTSSKCQIGWSTSWNQDCWEKYQ